MKYEQAILAVAGLVNLHNSQLVLELQSKGSFVIDGKTIIGLISNVHW